MTRILGVERLTEILKEDDPNKYVWKTPSTLNELVRDRVLPACRDSMAEITRLRAEVAQPNPRIALTCGSNSISPDMSPPRFNRLGSRIGPWVLNGIELSSRSFQLLFSESIAQLIEDAAKVARKKKRTRPSPRRPHYTWRTAMTREELWKYDLERYHRCKKNMELCNKHAKDLEQHGSKENAKWWYERAIAWQDRMDNVQALWYPHRME